MTLSLIVVVLFVVVGGGLWAPQWIDPKGRADLGLALLTGAGVSLAFFGLQNANEKERKELADKQSLQISLSQENDLLGVDLHGKDLRGVDLAFKDLTQANLRGANLSGVNLRGAILKRAKLDGAMLDGADLTRANLTEAVLNGASLKKATLTKVVLEGAEIGVQREDTLLSPFLARLGVAPTQVARPADLSGARLTDARMHHSCLAHAKLESAILGGADMRQAVVTHADLENAVIEDDGLRANLDEAAVTDIEGTPTTVLERTLPATTSAEPMLEPVPAHATTDAVVEVADGDTVKLERRGWVRLIGLDAPTPGEEPEGTASADFLKRLFRNGTRVRYTLGKHASEVRRDGNGRYRAYLWSGDRFVNGWLLQAGYVRRRPEGDEAVDGHRMALDQALVRGKSSGRRVWATCADR